jgi:predicted RNase H-like nuclease (RuvC/YqgF family)
MQLGGNPLVYKNVGQIEETEDLNLFLNSKSSQERQKWIIVGFDPGLTVGIAILDLSGNVISTKSCKEMSRAEVIKHIISYGKTILIATDVYPPPKMVKKLASILNSKIYSPSKTFTVSSKTELVDSYLSEISSTKYPENAHERDALAAAIKTYKHYQNKLRQIERRTEKLNLTDEEVDDIKSMVIRGRPISSAIDDILKVPEGTDDLEVQIEEMENDIESIDEEKLKNVEESARKLKQKIKSQERQIKNLKKKNRLLKKDVRKYKTKTSKLEGKIEKLHYDYSKDILRKKEISSKVALIKGLQEKYTEEKERREKLEENLRSIKKIRVMELSKKAVPVKIIESFTREKIRDAQEYWKIKRGDIVLLSSTEGGGSQTASLLINMGIKAVIAADKMSHPAEEEFEKNMVPVLDANKADLEMIDEFAVIERDVLNKEIENWKTRVENKRSKEEKKQILKVIDEYRAQRRRSSNGD